jgi:hypothetical protein
MGTKPTTNVTLSLVEPRSRRVVEQRKSHNIFVNYGRDWLVHLMSLDVAGATFRDDRVKYIAFGIGGMAQLVASADIRDPAKYNYPGFPDQWVAGAGGAGDPTQTHTDPTVTALEFPVEVVAGSYYDVISQPATFPDTGVVRYTAVLGVNEVSFGLAASVPLSEVLLVTAGLDDLPGGTANPPVVDPSLPSEKYGVAYNQFATLHKTNEFVLQVDWEIRIR